MEVTFFAQKFKKLLFINLHLFLLQFSGQYVTKFIIQSLFVQQAHVRAGDFQHFVRFGIGSFDD